MMRSLMVRIGVILVGMTLSGCGWDVGEIAPQATVRVPRDGRLYILNNIRPQTMFHSYSREFYILYEGQRFDPSPNMTAQKEPTLAGAMLLTPDPLPGGTSVDFDYGIEEVGNSGIIRNLSTILGNPIIIDGDITVEFYNYDWESPDGVVIPRVVAGKFDGIHLYSTGPTIEGVGTSGY